MSFRGLGTALVTPFKTDGALDERALEKFVDWQIGEGVNFLVPCGTTGENPALTENEQRRVIEIVVKKTNGRVPVLAGAGSNSTMKAIELAIIAIDCGADGVLTVVPPYNKPTPDGLRRHFGMQAEAIEKKRSRFPMILYNVPGRTGSNMAAATTVQIAKEIPNVVGIKEAAGNMEQLLQLVRDRPKGFLVLSGDDAWTLPLLAVGGDGLISVASNEVPRLMRDMIDKRSIEIQNRLLPVLIGNFIESNPGPVKSALKMMKILENDTVRPPLAPMTAANREKLEAILRECKLL